MLKAIAWVCTVFAPSYGMCPSGGVLRPRSLGRSTASTGWGIWSTCLQTGIFLMNNVITTCMSSIHPARQYKTNILDYWREKLQSVSAIDIDVLATYLVTSRQIQGHSTLKRTANLSGLAAHALRALLSSSTPNGRGELAQLAAACPSDYGIFDFLASETNTTSSSLNLSHEINACTCSAYAT